jgi:AcrR family transcriptional regulator
MAKSTNILKKHGNLRDSLIEAAERQIAREGLLSVRARALAEEAGCAVGAIYNVVADIDELIFAVNERTLAELEQHLEAAVAVAGDPARIDVATDRLTAMAGAYLDFAIENRMLWRAMFEHQIGEGREIPDSYRQAQMRLFGYVEAPLGVLLPQATPARRAVIARSLFSAVHGMVSLGLDEKLGALAFSDLREQVAFMTAAIARGVASA